MLPSAYLAHGSGKTAFIAPKNGAELINAPKLRSFFHQYASGNKRVKSKSNKTPKLSATTLAAPPAQEYTKANEGHVALLNGLGEVGEVAPALMPWLLRLSHIRLHLTSSFSPAQRCLDS